VKAVIQDLANGEVRVEEVPPPQLHPGGVLVRTRRSLISLGTERAVMSLAGKGPIGKARDRPDLARKVLNKAKQEGYWGTYRVVRNLLASPIPLGYSCAGEVIAVGGEVTELVAGDRVACAGLNFANHAEVNYIPRNLVVKLPADLDYDAASFVTVGTIAMHGVRLADLALGDVVVVIGLGLVGQLAAQLARAGGATVIATDLDPDKCELALRLGAHRASADPGRVQELVHGMTDGHGADAVLVCAAAESSAPLRQAVKLSRIRGRVVLVGDVGMDLERRPLFEKEVRLVVSRSYGPGRYDPAYEVRGDDYPYEYVRWTERRNMQAFIDLLARGDVEVAPLITHRYEIDAAENAYRTVKGADEDPPIGILLQYPGEEGRTRVVLSGGRPAAPPGTIRLGVIGAGQFAKGVLLPAFARSNDVRFEGFSTASGITSRRVAERFGAAFCTSDPAEIIGHDAIDAVVIATRHDRHAGLAMEALRSGKAVFVEKPLALDEDSLAELSEVLGSCENPRLMVGFNRRFSPLAVRCRDFFQPRTRPLNVSYRVNAGAVERGSWVLDPVEGGGRIIGEGCHFVDLVCYLTGSIPERVSAAKTSGGREADLDPDGIAITLRMADGSVGVIHYAANGDPSLPKEYCEVFGGGRVAILDNYRRATFHAGNRARKKRLWNQAKGHAEEVEAFLRALLRAEPMPIDPGTLIAVTQTTFLVHESLETGRTVEYRSPLRHSARGDA